MGRDEREGEVIYMQSETENKHLHVPVLHERAEESL